MVTRISLEQGAKQPSRGTPGSAGWDLFSFETLTIPPNQRRLVRTGIKLELPHGMWAQICSRSGLASKNSIDIGAGVIDNDYRGEIYVLMINSSNVECTVNKGNAIAQIVLRNLITFSFVNSELTSTSRGVEGFGSTDKK